MAVPWNEENAAHLLRRAGFGATPKELKKALKKGQKKLVQSLFKPWKKSDAFDGNIKEADLPEIQTWWLRRMVATSSPLIEKMSLMWHNHFATGNAKVENPRWMHQQNQTIRKHCLNSFQKLVSAIARDGAMLVWLDNESNVAGNPNENWARELMELFTNGVFDKNGSPNYTEADVQESARAFTGWSVSYPSGKFVFEEYNHDGGAKTFKGQTGNLDGQNIIDLLVLEPATARRVAWRIFTFFAYDVALDDPILDPLEQAYLDHDTAIEPVVETLFLMDEFYSTTAKRAHVKSPCEFLIGAIRLLGGDFPKNVDPYDLSDVIDRLGQSIFNPPSVFGWKEGTTWLSSNGVINRMRVAERVADARKGDRPPVTWKPEKLLGDKKKWKSKTAADVVDLVAARLGPAGLDPLTVATLEDYLQRDPSGSLVPFVLDEETVDSKVRGLVALILSSPEYQFA